MVWGKHMYVDTDVSRVRFTFILNPNLRLLSLFCSIKISTFTIHQHDNHFLPAIFKHLWDQLSWNSSSFSTKDPNSPVIPQSWAKIRMVCYSTASPLCLTFRSVLLTYSEVDREGTHYKISYNIWNLHQKFLATSYCRDGFKITQWSISFTSKQWFCFGGDDLPNVWKLNHT